jgi:hypothetical protein
MEFCSKENNGRTQRERNGGDKQALCMVGLESTGVYRKPASNVLSGDQVRLSSPGHAVIALEIQRTIEFEL